MARQPNAICTVCGKAYWRQTTHLARSRFCSNPCKLKGGGFGRGQPGDVIHQADLQRLYYQEHLSMQQIADQYGCSVHKVAYWMERFGFERRSWSEATYLHHHPGGDPFQIRMPETSEDWQLFSLGIGIYMGEGNKKSQYLSVANSNPQIHRIFILFLEQICGVDRTQLNAWLNVYDDCDVENTLDWWAMELGLKREQFFKPLVRASRGGTQRQKSPNGTLSIYYGNFKLRNLVLKWCEEYYTKYDMMYSSQK